MTSHARRGSPPSQQPQTNAETLDDRTPPDAANCATDKTSDNSDNNNVTVKTLVHKLSATCLNANHTGSSSNPNVCYGTTCGIINNRSKSLMESLLVAKMERAASGTSGVSGAKGRTLVRTDSVDSASSMGSLSSLSSDVCRCDDCLLGIADLYAQTFDDDVKHRKKVIETCSTNKRIDFKSFRL